MDDDTDDPPPLDRVPPPEVIEGTSSWSAADVEALRQAKDLLEQPSLLAKLTGLLGTPIERGVALLPAQWSEKVEEAARLALSKSLQAAVWSLGAGAPEGDPSDRWHRIAVAATGAAGGAFGLVALPIELPVSTALMLRSIADVARSEGEDLARVDAQLACLEVFAIGGRSASDDASETGYFAVRASLARAVSEAARFVAQRGVYDRGAPPLVRLIAAVSARFGVVVGEKVAATLVPLIGGVSGALINGAFMTHFQAAAHGHFAVRRLERAYGPDDVRERYAALP